MKKMMALLMAAGLLVGGCATDSSSQSAAKPSEKNPEIGMTKEQVVGLYGPTESRQMSSEGETWIYHLNMGEAFIPFNFGYRPKTRIIHFDKDGKVTNWSYTK